MTIHLAGAAGPPEGPYDADVIILALDRVEETRAAIASALEQRGLTRHVFVLDQGSAPTARAWIAAALAGRTDATMLAAPRNLGVAGGRNLLTGLGHGRVIAGLDNDAVFATDTTLAHMVAALDEAPDLAAVGCRIVRHADGADDDTSWGYPQSLRPRAGDSFDAVTFVGAGHAIRRAAWAEAGGYDARLYFCWEEYDFCLRAIAHGWRVRYRGDLVVRHRVSAEQRVGWSERRWFQFVRNRLYIERKYGASWPCLLPRLAAYTLRGTLSGLMWPTIAAASAAAAMARDVPPITLPPAARDYLVRNDLAHRGGLARRLQREVLRALPGAQQHPQWIRTPG